MLYQIAAANHKGINHPVAGKADILLVPDIEAGNILYKSLVFFSNTKNAGVIVGAKAPIILTSRADNEETKLNSIALGVLMAQKLVDNIGGLKWKIYSKYLTINPGSTSTKIAVFDNEDLVFEKTLRHSSEEIGKYEKISDQFEFRKTVIEDALTEGGIKTSDLDAVVGRGGLLKPIQGGTYNVR